MSLTQGYANPRLPGQLNVVWWHQIYVSSVCNLLHVGLMAPTILRTVLDFCKICVTLVSARFLLLASSIPLCLPGEDNPSGLAQ